MAVAALAALVQNLLLTATVYLLVGFEVTPSTVIGFLTILGFALYDVVVVFDKVRENTRGITGNPNRTYGEAANLAVNQTLMRSINTAIVALLPVGGLLFIGAGLLGAGTLKDLGLVLFVGMLAAVYSSIFFATPVLVDLKEAGAEVQAAQAAGAGRGGPPARSRPSRRPAPTAARRARRRRRPRGQRRRPTRSRTARWPTPRRGPAPRPRRASARRQARGKRAGPRCQPGGRKRWSGGTRRSARGPAVASVSVCARRMAATATAAQVAELVASHVIDVPDFPKDGHRLQGPEPAVRRRAGVPRRSSTRSSAHYRPDGFDVVAGIEARGFLIAAAVAYAAGVGRRAGPQGRQAAPGHPRGDLRPGVRLGHAGGPRGRVRRRASGCSSSTTCWPPAVPPRRRCPWSSGPAATVAGLHGAAGARLPGAGVPGCAGRPVHALLTV